MSEFKTESRGWRFFSTDVQYMLGTGMSPKVIFRLGCIAHRDNPQLLSRIRELEEGNTKLQRKLTAVSNTLNKELDRGKPETDQ